MDADKDEQFLIYSSISPVVHLVDVETLCAKHERLEFKTEGRGHPLMSIKFSGDGKKILAGSKSGHILIYDMN